MLQRISGKRRAIARVFARAASGRGRPFNYFAQELNTGVLVAPDQESSGGNGVWGYGEDCPTTAGQASYFVDVIVDGIH